MDVAASNAAASVAGSAAGTSRVDRESQASRAASTQRTADADAMELSERSRSIADPQGSGDRDADGRMPFGQPPAEDQSSDAGAGASPPTGRDQSEGNAGERGGRIDLTA